MNKVRTISVDLSKKHRIPKGFGNSEASLDEQAAETLADASKGLTGGCVAHEMNTASLEVALVGTLSLKQSTCLLEIFIKASFVCVGTEALDTSTPRYDFPR